MPSSTNTTTCDTDYETELFGLAASFLPNHILFFLAMLHSHTHSSFFFLSLSTTTSSSSLPAWPWQDRTGVRGLQTEACLCWVCNEAAELSVNLSDKAGRERLLLELLKHRICHVSSGRGREACRQTLKTIKTERRDVCHYLRLFILSDGAKFSG